MHCTINTAVALYTCSYEAIPYMATQGTCYVVENKQSAVGGYYSDVKSPKRVYTELDTLIPYLLLVSVMWQFQ